MVLRVSDREFLITTLARSNRVLALDHVSALTPQIADALCRVAFFGSLGCYK